MGYNYNTIVCTRVKRIFLCVAPYTVYFSLGFTLTTESFALLTYANMLWYVYVQNKLMANSSL